MRRREFIGTAATALAAGCCDVAGGNSDDVRHELRYGDRLSFDGVCRYAATEAKRRNTRWAFFIDYNFTAVEYGRAVRVQQRMDGFRLRFDDGSDMDWRFVQCNIDEFKYVGVAVQWGVSPSPHCWSVNEKHDGQHSPERGEA